MEQARCPECRLNWMMFPPVKIDGEPRVRCVECKRTFLDTGGAALAAAQAEIARLAEMPWRRGILACWSIVGMNHYYIPGQGRCLFVAMGRFDKMVKVEGKDSPELWAELERKADAALTGETSDAG